MEQPSSFFANLNWEAFRFYCCPNCEDKFKSKKDFVLHVFTKHSQNNNDSREEEEEETLKMDISVMFATLISLFVRLAKREAQLSDLLDTILDYLKGLYRYYQKVVDKRLGQVLIHFAPKCDCLQQIQALEQSSCIESEISAPCGSPSSRIARKISLKRKIKPDPNFEAKLSDN